MSVMRFLPILATLVILLVSLLSGPLVGAVDLSPATSSTAPGDGNATVQVVSVPDEGRLSRAGYTTSGYVLSVPPATVDVSNRSGNPMLVYKVRIRELGFTASSTHFLESTDSGRQTLTLNAPVLNRTSLDVRTYRGELLVVKRAHEVDTVLRRGNVTIRVER